MDSTHKATLKIMAKHGLPPREEEQRDIDHQWGPGFEIQPANPIVEKAIRTSARKRRHQEILKHLGVWGILLTTAVLMGWGIVEGIEWLFNHHIWSAQ